MEKSLWSGCRWRESLQLVVGGLIVGSFHNTGLVELCTRPDSFFLTSGQCCLFFHFIFAFPLIPKGVDHIGAPTETLSQVPVQLSLGHCESTCVSHTHGQHTATSPEHPALRKPRAALRLRGAFSSEQPPSLKEAVCLPFGLSGPRAGGG